MEPVAGLAQLVWIDVKLRSLVELIEGGNWTINERG